jgi:secreted trypsin-like serine protease
MKRYLSIGLVLIVQASLFIAPINAMENGFDAPLEGRTVSISAEPIGIVCTGFMYTERIVLTAGHCLFNGQTKERLSNSKIGIPQEVFSKESKKISAIKSIGSPNWAWSDDQNSTPSGEFGIYILSEPIPVKGKVSIATKEKVSSYLSQGILIDNVAYGKQTPEQNWSGYPTRAPKYAQFPLVSIETVDQFLEGVWQVMGKRKNYHMTIHVLQLPNGPSTCGGDSGSPFYVKEGDEYFYLGPLSNGIGAIPNCSGKPWEDKFMYMGAVAAYDYLDLIAEAEKYVADNPYVAPKTTSTGFNKKITVTCVKGKTTKKVRGVTPKCPKGFKKI